MRCGLSMYALYRSVLYKQARALHRGLTQAEELPQLWRALHRGLTQAEELPLLWRAPHKGLTQVEELPPAVAR